LAHNQWGYIFNSSFTRPFLNLTKKINIFKPLIQKYPYLRQTPWIFKKERKNNLNR